ncbi:MAG TPA: AraC family transcriptional regulator [Pseudonocardiaceae bacterium]|jgi:AraC-like DNA-binding protein
METIEVAVGRVIEAMRDNLGERLTIDDMARTAMFSKFHFSRLFRKVTGVSPGRFLSAMRLQEAKHLLVTTSLTVTEISHQVGYTSVGTFSSRFRKSVGVSPTTYRQLGGFTAPIAIDRRRGAATRSATVRGEIHSPLTDRLGLIFVGLFTDRIPQGQPVRCTVLYQPGPYVLEDVPQGTWYLLAHSVAAGLEEFMRGPLAEEQTLCVGSHGPIRVRPDTTTVPADVLLGPVPAPDPEVLTALLDIRSVALSVGAA